MATKLTWVVAAGLSSVLLAACTTTMSEAERDALMAECQLINDDDERRACLERLAIGEPNEPMPEPRNTPVNY